MTTKESFWMACDSVEQLRAEYGPFQTRAEAEAEAHKLGFGFLLRYEHIIDANENIQEERCIFIEFPRHPHTPTDPGPSRKTIGVVISLLLALLPLLGIVYIVFFGSLTTVDGLFMSLILLSISEILGLNALIELRKGMA